MTLHGFFLPLFQVGRPHTSSGISRIFLKFYLKMNVDLQKKVEKIEYTEFIYILHPASSNTDIIHNQGYL